MPSRNSGWLPSYKIVDLSMVFCKRLPEGTPWLRKPPYVDIPLETAIVHWHLQGPACDSPNRSKLRLGTGGPTVGNVGRERGERAHPRCRGSWMRKVMFFSMIIWLYLEIPKQRKFVDFPELRFPQPECNSWCYQGCWFFAEPCQGCTASGAVQVPSSTPTFTKQFHKKKRNHTS